MALLYSALSLEYYMDENLKMWKRNWVTEEVWELTTAQYNMAIKNLKPIMIETNQWTVYGPIMQRIWRWIMKKSIKELLSICVLFVIGWMLMIIFLSMWGVIMKVTPISPVCDRRKNNREQARKRNKDRIIKAAVQKLKERIIREHTINIYV